MWGTEAEKRKRHCEERRRSHALKKNQITQELKELSREATYNERRYGEE